MTFLEMGFSKVSPARECRMREVFVFFRVRLGRMGLAARIMTMMVKRNLWAGLILRK